jgi:8-oxo-dGTP diphosphatase
METVVVAKTLVFNEQKQLLLLVRSDDDMHRAGGFDLPGGQVEDGEEITAGAIREAKEEAGLTLDFANMQLVYSLTRLGGHNGHRSNIVRLFFITQVAESEVTLSHEHQSYDWYTLDEARATTNHLVHHEVLDYICKNTIAAEFWS